MAGTREGGLKAHKTNLERHGKDFYKKIGAKGGRNGTRKGIKNGEGKSPSSMTKYRKMEDTRYV